MPPEDMSNGAKLAVVLGGTGFVALLGYLACRRDEVAAFWAERTAGGPGAAMYVTAPSGLNLRSAASTTSGVLRGLPYGTQVTVLTGDVQNGFMMVSVPGAQGWASTQWLSATKPTGGGKARGGKAKGRGKGASQGASTPATAAGTTSYDSGGDSSGDSEDTSASYSDALPDAAASDAAAADAGEDASSS